MNNIGYSRINAPLALGGIVGAVTLSADIAHADLRASAVADFSSGYLYASGTSYSDDVPGDWGDDLGIIGYVTVYEGFSSNNFVVPVQSFTEVPVSSQSSLFWSANETCSSMSYWFGTVTATDFAFKNGGGSHYNSDVGYYEDLDGGYDWFMCSS